MVAGMDDLNTPFISLNRAVQDDKRMNTTGTISPAFLVMEIVLGSYIFGFRIGFFRLRHCAFGQSDRKLNQHRQDNCDVRGYAGWSGQTGMELRLQKQPYKDTESFC
jgi:hypothetical protein